MTTVRSIFLYMLAFACAFAWLWRSVIETTTGRRSPMRLWPPLQFNARYVAQVLQRVWYCSLGLFIAAVSFFLLFALFHTTR